MTGGTRVDLHVKVIGEDVVRRARNRGLDALVYAPHFTRLPVIRERADRYSRRDLAVIPAREVFTGSWRHRRHVLAIGLTDPVPDFIPLDAAMAEFRRQGAAVLVPHPTFATVSLDAEDVRRYRDHVHAIEVYNPKHLAWHNRRARRLSRDLEIPPFASSYAHLPWTVGDVRTTFEDRVRDEADLVAALRDAAPRGIDVRRDAGHAVNRAAEIAHLLYENSWQKFDRIALSGREATHPSNPAYAGRFDAVTP